MNNEVSEGRSMSVQEVVENYRLSIERGDLKLAETVWLTTEQASFIHPRGHELGWRQIRENFYEKTMIAPFSSRKLDVYRLRVTEALGVTWAEFYWRFDAVFSSDGAPLHTEGRETQLIVPCDGALRIAHVHYSNMPVVGEREGF